MKEFDAFEKYAIKAIIRDDNFKNKGLSNILYGILSGLSLYFNYLNEGYYFDDKNKVVIFQRNDSNSMYDSVKLAGVIIKYYLLIDYLKRNRLLITYKSNIPDPTANDPKMKYLYPIADNDVYNIIKKYTTHHFIVTQELITFVNNGFRTEEDIHQRKVLCWTRFAAIISFLGVLASMFF